MLPLVQEEVNIRKIHYVEEGSDFVKYDLKPQFKVMGPKYGKKMKAIAGYLEQSDASEALQAFANNKAYTFTLDGDEISLVPEDLVVQIQPREGYQFASMKDIFVALDTSLSEDLLREGYAREIINKIQYSRKEQGFEIMDRIRVKYQGPREIQEAIAEYKDYIMSETLADALEQSTDPLDEVDLNGINAALQVTKSGN
jgi:isoleucyl-tRNA synthetase